MAKLTGTNPGQTPTNADLGTMAYQDATDVKLGNLRVEGDSGSPQVRLGTSDGYLEVNSFSSNPTYVVFGGSNITQGAFGTQGNIDLSLLTNNTERMRITSTGEVRVISGLLELNGNDIGGTQVTIADDAVASITPPRNGGFMFVTSQGTSDYPNVTSSAVIFYDVGASLTCLKQSFTGIGSIVLVSTSDVTGTTSTDNSITVAVQSGVIKIENRIGSNNTLQITFL